jgi:hypothetical protein
MPLADPGPDPAIMRDFVTLCGNGRWAGRLEQLGAQAQPRSLLGRAAQQRHALELTLARLCKPKGRESSAAERIAAGFAREVVQLAKTLPADRRARLEARLAEGLTGEATLIPLFHLLRTAALHRARGFEVSFAGLAEDAPFDLRISRDGAEAEVACETVSAEAGRSLHRGDWWRLVDQINPELQTWLAAHPGRYLLKMTLPDRIHGQAELAGLHQRVMDLLQAQRRQDASAEAVLKLDPLVLAGAQAAVAGLPAQLRAQFGPEAHLAVTTSADRQGNAVGSVFVMAARSGREDGIAAAVCSRMAAAASTRLTGQRPGILAVFLEDLDRNEWRGLRERLELEGATRRFLTGPAARPVVAVSCSSRMEMFGLAPPDAVPEGELRFRNPSHPAARVAALGPAIQSSV